MDANAFDALAQASQSAQRNSRRSSRRASVASNMNPNINLHKLQFELTIRKLFLQNAPDGASFMVLWIRGGKHIDTRVKTAQDS